MLTAATIIIVAAGAFMGGFASGLAGFGTGLDRVSGVTLIWPSLFDS